MTSANNNNTNDTSSSSSNKIQWDEPSSLSTKRSSSSNYKSNNSRYRGVTQIGTRVPAWMQGPLSSQANIKGGGGGGTDLGLNMAPIKLNYSSSQVSSLGGNPATHGLFTNLSVKTQAPVLEVHGGATEAVAVAQEAQQLRKEVSKLAPQYDYFQPMLAHFSKTKTPAEMRVSVEDTLKLLVEAGIVDYYPEKDYVFAGRAYGEYGDCEYRITIFSDDENEHQSVTEIRRSCGEAFTFANAESKILHLLRKRGAIEKYEHPNAANKPSGPSSSEAMPSLSGMDGGFSGGMSSSSSDEDDDEETNSMLGQFSFGMLPNYDNMEFDLPEDLPHFELKYSNETPATTATATESKNSGAVFKTAAADAEDDDNNNNNDNRDAVAEADDEDALLAPFLVKKESTANICVDCAVREDTVQDEWRFDVVHLKQQMDKDAKTYANMENIVPRLLNAIGDTNFDAFVTRTILQCIGCLLQENVQLPSDFVSRISVIQLRWEEVVENQVSDEVSFKFAPSQQVVKECDLILKNAQ